MVDARMSLAVGKHTSRRPSRNLVVERLVGGARRLLLGSVQRIQLFLLMVVLVPVLFYQSCHYYTMFQARSAQELQANLELARAVAANFQAYVRDAIYDEAAIGLAITMPQPLPPEQVKRLLMSSAREHPSVCYYRWVDPQGRVVASSRSEADVDVGSDPHFQRIVAGEDWPGSLRRVLVPCRPPNRPGTPNLVAWGSIGASGRLERPETPNLVTTGSCGVSGRSRPGAQTFV